MKQGRIKYFGERRCLIAMDFGFREELKMPADCRRELEAAADAVVAAVPGLGTKRQVQCWRPYNDKGFIDPAFRTIELLDGPSRKRRKN